MSRVTNLVSIPRVVRKAFGRLGQGSGSSLCPEFSLVRYDSLLGNRPSRRPFLTAKAEDGEKPIPLCTKCYDDVFSPEPWSKLQGLHPRTIRRHGESSDCCFQGDTQYLWVYGKRYPPRRDPIVRISRSIEGLKENSTTCSLCRIAYELIPIGQLRDVRYDNFVIDVQLLYSIIYSGIRHPLLLSVKLYMESDSNGKRKQFSKRALVATMVERPESHRRHPGLPESIPDSANLGPHSSAGGRDSMPVADDGILGQARRWLDNCEANHPECRLSQAPPLPLRVLKVQYLNGAYHIRLIVHADTSEARGRYMALSYVWGPKKDGLRLLRNNYESFLSNIAYEELPKTMQDAVTVTCALGISYLWIDALCLLQDDDYDKGHQIPRMNEYYQNAVVVISASGASDSDAGFLIQQPSESDVYAKASEHKPFIHPKHGSVPYRIPCTLSTGEQFFYLLNPQPSLYNYEAEPINRRGWTLQETDLARRLLTFPSTGGIIARCSHGAHAAGQVLGDPFHETPGSMFHDETVNEFEGPQRFESTEYLRESGANERGTNEARDQDVNQWRARGLYGRVWTPWEIDQQAQQRKTTPLDRASDDWITAVQDYSRRQLSNAKDILIALSGLAKDFSAREGHLLGHYVAGLWKNALPKMLLWHTPFRGSIDSDTGMFSSSVDPRVFAPSWSWASSARPVTFRTDQETDIHDMPDGYTPQKSFWCIEILDCVTVPTSRHNAFGATLGGYLDIKGTLLPIERQQPPQGVTQDKLVLAIRLADDEQIGYDEDTLASADSPATARMIDSSCYWLPVYYAARGCTRGLIIRQEADGDFRRLGFAEFRYKPEEYGENLDMQVIRIV